jgi:uncharacterized membrane protein YkoI
MHHGGMERRMVIVSLAAVATAAAATGAGFAIAGSADDDGEAPITGDALRNASAAALEHTGGGRVTGTEVGDEESLYEVEVTLDDGRQVDVQLDDDFRVVGEEADDDTAEDDSAEDDTADG